MSRIIWHPCQVAIEVGQYMLNDFFTRVLGFEEEDFEHFDEIMDQLYYEDGFK